MSGKTLGDLIGQLRQQANLSQKELADTCDRPAPSISYYENDRREPPLEALIGILNALEGKLLVESQGECWELTPSGNTGDTPQVQPAEECSVMLDGLPDQERQDLLEYLRKRLDHSGG